MHGQELTVTRDQRVQEDAHDRLHYHGHGKGLELHLPLGAGPAQDLAVPDGAVHDYKVCAHLGKGVPSSAWNGGRYTRSS